MCHFHEIEDEQTEWELIEKKEAEEPPADDGAEPEVIADGGEE